MIALGDRIAEIRLFWPRSKGMVPGNLLSRVPKGGALVAPLFTSWGSAVLVIPHGCCRLGPENVVNLPGFALSDLHRLLDEWRKAYPSRSERAAATDAWNWRGWKDTIDAMGEKLWESLMGDVHESLVQLSLDREQDKAPPPVVIMPQAGIGLLPLHAAWRKDRATGKKFFFQDDFTVSYAFGGRALGVSQRRSCDRRARACTVRAVADPATENAPTLRFPGNEATEIARFFGPGASRILCGRDATAANVRDAIRDGTYVHFACHAEYNWNDPMRSRLLLAGKDSLCLAEIIRDAGGLSQAPLVSLSACETGLTDIDWAPDEYIGMPAGFLQAGASAVISSLWPVNDRSTALLMTHFYWCHLKCGMEPAQALWKAQAWLRTTRARCIREAVEDNVRAPVACSVDGERSLLELDRGDETAGEGATPYSHSYHWAGWTLTGC